MPITPPNVVDMIFGRIDRNTDTRYRDRALDQNQSQFQSTYALDQERQRLEQARLAAQREQFEKSFGVTQEHQKLLRDQFQQAGQLALLDAINTGKVQGEAPGYQPTPQADGVMPGNIFMQRPLAAVGGMSSPGVPSLTIGGSKMRPNTPMSSFLEAEKMKRIGVVNQRNVQSEDMNFLMKDLGLHPLEAMFAVKYPEIYKELVRDPKTKLAAFSTLREPPKALMNALMQGQVDLTSNMADAAETPAHTLALQGQANSANAQAGYYRAMAAAAGSKADMMMPGAGRRVAEVLTILANSGISNADPAALSYAAQVVDRSPWDQGTKDAVMKSLATEFVSKPQPGIGGLITNFDPRKFSPGAPTVNPSRESGAGVDQVNTKPPSVSGPPGSAALQYTQPVRPNPFGRPRVVFDPVTGQPVDERSATQLTPQQQQQQQFDQMFSGPRIQSTQPTQSNVPNILQQFWQRLNKPYVAPHF